MAETDQADSTNDEPWYKDGLRFECTQCGNCCTGTPGAVWVEESDLEAIAEYLEKPIGEIRVFHTRPLKGRMSLKEFANGDCTFFDPHLRRCRIYPVRPAQCRVWPFWSVHLTDRKAWEDVGRECPGIGRGDFVSLEVIEQRAAETHL
ncbi:YkgJ family cysteine cluster protein [Calycomorphotria hydatis]|uniref:Flagellin N-methylase n=1 Tax=Calycomorphotria hydatis TaxID=2528027 RepID=A0A517T760_9PLAN|nr:YkgJ family cysteine cluster protein [Calycomorphotria hydatis]QDT64211.1 Flagellin N-methylase [Calycomorphotria hydatis]